MSFSFYVEAPRAPSVAELAGFANDERWRCDDAPEDLGDDEPLPEGYVCHAYLHGASARGVELAYEDGALSARIMSCSTRADHELAIAIAAGFATQHDARVKPEDRDAGLTVAELRAEFDDAYIADQVDYGPGIVATMVEREGSTLTLSGCRRPFHVGPRFLATLRARGGALRDRLFEAFLQLQYIDDDDACFCASAMTVKPKSGGDSFTVAAWASGVRYVFPQVDRFAVLGESLVEVPYAVGMRLAGDGWAWLDEQHALVDAIADDDWPAFVARARAALG